MEPGVLGFLERRFWLAGATTAAVCATLALGAARHLLEVDADEVALTPTPALAPPPTAAPRAKDGEALAARNMFCSDCAPSPPDEGDDEPEVVEDDGAIAETALPLDLVATSVAARSAWSVATVRNRSTGQQGAFGVGDALPGAGPIEQIASGFVVFRNPASARLERVSLLERAQAGDRVASARPSPAAAAMPVRGRAAAPPSVASVAGVRQVSERAYEIERGLIERLLANPGALTREGRVQPRLAGGEVVGLGVSSMRRGSMFEAIGLQNGDVLRTVNGHPLRTPDEMLAAYTSVQQRGGAVVEVARGTGTVTLDYRIR
jgi:general secretion pathway protein C